MRVAKQSTKQKPPLPEDVEAGKGSPVGNNLTTLQGLKNLLCVCFLLFCFFFKLTFFSPN